MKTATMKKRDKTNAILQNAIMLMKDYEEAVGAHISIMDHEYNFLPVLSGEKFIKKTCLYCIKHKNHMDLTLNHCKKMHSNAIIESQRRGGSFSYKCPSGIIFWVSPIFQNDIFAGAVLGSKYAENNNCDGEPEGIKAYAELMLICARYLSIGSRDYYASMKQRTEQELKLSAEIEKLKGLYPQDSNRPYYPLEKEKKLLEMLRSGDIKQSKHLINEIMAILQFAYPDNFRNIQYRAIELAVLISRTDTIPGYYAKTILEANSRYINSIQEANDIMDIAAALHRMVEGMEGQITGFRGINHASAMKKAERFILENYSRKICLEEIAAVSGFSSPYFSTIFKEEMGENFSSYLNRLRIKKAHLMLSKTNFSLNRIAKICGFEDQSWFSKIFKIYTGMSPGKFRAMEKRPMIKIHETEYSDDYEKMIKDTSLAMQ